MMRIIISILSALSLNLGMVQEVIAKPVGVATAASGSCTGPAFTWQHLGGAPFARSEAEAMKKLPKALNDMVAAGCLPKNAVDGVLKLVRENPKGTSVNGGHQLVTLTNGMHLDFMESAHRTYQNVTVGLVSVGRGLVAGVQAKVWVFDVDGMRFILYMPLICFNWSLQRLNAPPVLPPPPAEEQCYVIRTPFNVREDRSNHFGLYGPDAMRGDCFRWRYEGERSWHSYSECPDDACDYDAVTRDVGGMRLVLKGRTVFAPPPGARYVEYRVSAAFATRNVNLALFCRELVTGRMSCGKMVRYDDYHDRVATIYRTLDDYHAANAVGRVLVWDFFVNPADCRKYWTH